ncbi:DUF3221 domain-containing protein [Metabacillus bambusae]|uniref:YobA family protein n=1 Tax=Metabacillus bambusae TaxID=2795218 RepID=A0ABS3N143_9BACI|nr:DUF3221 domain-containing protein [Metabacillus bambusae]MBO1511903.1 YobA family protein [Metabacillus bambusae]
MKKILVLFLILPSILIGCGTNPPSSSTGTTNTTQEDPATENGMKMEGYVIQRQPKQILVVNPTPNEYTDAVWFSNVPDSIEIGEKVKVSFDVLLESYPGQAEAKKIEKLDSHKPQGADLTEAAAIKKSLTGNSTESRILSNLQYNHELDTWKIEFENIDGDKVIHGIEDN